MNKEIFKCKVLTASASQCFSATKVERDESKRMLIHFTDVIGLEVRENSIVMDVKSRPKFEKKVHTKDRENGKTGGGKWTEENMHVEEGSSPNRIELVMVGRREPVTAKLQEVLSKVPSLKKAINRGLATVHDNVLYDQQIFEDRYPLLQDPTLVRTGQLAFLRLLPALPLSNKAEFVTKIYAGIKRKFNQLLRERVQKTIN